MDRGFVVVSAFLALLALAFSLAWNGVSRLQLVYPVQPPRNLYVAYVTGASGVPGRVHLLLWNNSTLTVYVTRVLVSAVLQDASCTAPLVLGVARVGGHTGGVEVQVTGFTATDPPPSGVVVTAGPVVTDVVPLLSIAMFQGSTGDVFRDVDLSSGPIAVQSGGGVAVVELSGCPGNVSMSLLFYAGGW